MLSTCPGQHDSHKPCVTIKVKFKSPLGFAFSFLAALGLRCCSRVLRRAFSSCREHGPLSSCGAQASHCSGFSCCRVPNMGFRCMGFNSCSMHAQWLWHTGLVAPWHVKSFWTRDRIYVPSLHWTTTREIQKSLSFTNHISSGQHPHVASGDFIG